MPYDRRIIAALSALIATLAFALFPFSASAQAPCINVRLAPYNAAGNGITDDSPAFNAAFAAGQSSGVPVCVPGAGGFFYKLATNLAPITAPLTIIGDSPYSSVLGSVQTTGDVLTLAGPNIIVRNLGVEDAIAKTSGALIKLTPACTSCVVDTWYMPFPYVGIDVAASNARITNGDVRFSISGAGSAAVVFSGGAGSTLTNTSIDVDYGMSAHPSPLPIPESGVSVAGAVTSLLIDGVRVHNATVCFRLSQGSGVTIAHSTCDAATIGVRAQPTLGAIDHLTLDTVRVTNTTANGMTFAGGAGGAIANIAVNNSTIEAAGGNGIAITAGVSLVQVNGGTISSNAGSGFFAAPGVSSWSVQGANLNANAAYGVCASAGAGDFLRVIGNDAHGNVSGSVFNATTGTHSVIAQNIN